MRLFSDPDCTCDPKLVAVAMLEGRELEPCIVHEPDHVAELEAEHVHVQRRNEADLLRDVIDEMKAGDQLAARRRNRQADDVRREASFAAIDRADPMLAAVLRKTGWTPPLNSKPDGFPALSGMTEASSTDPFDGPDAA